MVKLLQPVLTAEMMTTPVIALLALPLAQLVHAPVLGGIELVVGHAPQGHRTGLNSPLALGTFCGDRRHCRSPSADCRSGTRSCGVAVIVLEEPF